MTPDDDDAVTAVSQRRDPTATIREACDFILSDDIDSAAQAIRERYPFTAVEKSSRKYSKATMLEVFRRDGFMDRYRGTKLVFPGALRILSETGAMPRRTVDASGNPLPRK